MRTAVSVPLGPLGRRFLAAFAAVALVAVGLVGAAGLVGSSLGLSRSGDEARRQTVHQVVDATQAAYREAGGWEAADLTRALTIAADAGARLVVVDAQGRVLTSTRGGMGMGPGMGPGVAVPAMGRSVQVTQRISVDGEDVGTVLVRFPTGAADVGRRVAWSWILAAAPAAVLVALVAGWWVARTLTRPLVALTAATRQFAAGDLDARPQIRGVGELGELATAFDQAAEAVAEEQRLRRQVTADVAHELRTPLSALQAGLEELRDGLVPADQQTLSRLHDQALRVSRTVHELSELSAADAAAAGLRRQRVDLGELTADAVAARQAQLRAAGLTVRTDLGTGVVVCVDPDRWHQIVGNLLDNCARHCRDGDQVGVRVTAPARLEIADSGPGIPPDELPRVTERFWRGRDRHQVSGSGVGLAVVARLVKAHGASLSIRSDGRSGTTVVIEGLPTVTPDRSDAG